MNFTEKHTEISEKDKAIISMTNRFESKRKEGYLMQPQESSMEDRFVKPLEIFFFANYQKKKKNKKGIGLYRDDGLAMLKNISGSKAEKKYM